MLVKGAPALLSAFKFENGIAHFADSLTGWLTDWQTLSLSLTHTLPLSFMLSSLSLPSLWVQHPATHFVLRLCYCVDDYFIKQLETQVKWWHIQSKVDLSFVKIVWYNLTEPRPFSNGFAAYLEPLCFRRRESMYYVKPCLINAMHVRTCAYAGMPQ